jgi:phosphoribosyl 1,2-cyclic phosphodiesterase
MKLRFWGTRGSIATPGKGTVRYGGNTPCTELRLSDGTLIILDAGTGIRNLGDHLCETNGQVRAFLLISHPHWDHIQGFPFFRPAFIPGNELTIIGGENDHVTVQSMVKDQMNNIYFPLHISDLRAKLEFRRADQGEFHLGAATVQTIFVNHPSFAMGYRITEGGKSVVYISDNEPFDRAMTSYYPNVEQRVLNEYMNTSGDPNQRIYDFARGADLLIHDATYTPEEYPEHYGWGHSHYGFTLNVAALARVKRLALFHHDPSHTDDELDAILAKCRAEITRCGYGFDCLAAVEGMELSI